MFQFNIDFIKKMQYYAVSQLRLNPDYRNLCEVIGQDFNDLKKISEYLLKSINIDEAEGVWLDYIGWLVGTTRVYFDIGDFFSVNSDDLNAEKYFYFPGTAVGGETNLDDVFFRKRIYAKIGYNISKGTREENIYILKNLTFAKKVIIKRVAPLVLDITLIGNDIIQTPTFKEDIEKVLGLCVGTGTIKVLGE